MIDPADQQTLPLLLDELPAKKRRGRPSTGKAMTPAEKQRAYRERQKAKSGYVDPATVEEIKRMQAEITSLRAALVATDELREENEKLKKQLSSRDEKPARVKRHRDDTPNVLKEYEAQAWVGKKWKTIGEDDPENMAFSDWQEADEFVRELRAGGSTMRYRIIPAHMPIIEYK